MDGLSLVNPNDMENQEERENTKGKQKEEQNPKNK